MSLLIKALDNAEKNKKAEKAKKSTDESQVASPTLELEAIEPKITPESSTADIPEISSAKPKQNFADKGLTLEEEAGLSLSLDPKYVKPKRGTDKAVEKSSYQSSNSDKSVEKEKALKSISQGTVSTSNNKAPVLPAVFQTIAAQNHDTHQKAAAKVFVANQSVRNSSSKSALLILGIAGALMIWLGLQGYTYIKTLLAPAEVVVVKPAVPNPQEMATVVAEAGQATQGSTEANPPVPAATDMTQPSSQAQASAASGNPTKVPDNIVETRDDAVVQASPESNSFAVAKSSAKNSRSKKANNDVYGDEDSAVNTGKTPIKLVSKPLVNGVDPTLLSAYQAFNRGEDALAQQQYRQVLQRDVRNVDALLGMAAIAQRQGRDADAFGWYQKVLEVEPKNTVAQSALINAQASTDGTATESRIKSMLAQQPEAAHLHEALGNLYAGQNQWPAAQEAYFNASRYAPNNADYAFNLAISLEHLGKSGLALVQYQRTLDLVNKSGAASPDKTQLETRIRTLQ